MASNIRKQADEDAVRPPVNETSAGGTGASGTVDSVDAKNRNDAPQPPNAWPAELGWDFPFDFPKPAR